MGLDDCAEPLHSGRVHRRPPRVIDQLSLHPLHLTIFGKARNELGTGTGFLAQGPTGRLLLTARHLVTGLGRQGPTYTEVFKQKPASILIRHHTGNPPIGLNNEVQLYDGEGRASWFEDPEWRCLSDIAAVPVAEQPDETTALTALDDLILTFRLKQAVELQTPTLRLLPAEVVSVIGYPFGESVYTLPIWATGFVASEPSFTYNGPGSMLIDCRARQGQSGSPVFAKRLGDLVLSDGQHVVFDGTAHCFVGMYVGRLNKESDLGIVYRAPALRRLVERCEPGHDCFQAPTPQCA